MPQMDGYEAARLIRSKPGGERLLLVAVSGWGQEEDKQRNHEAGTKKRPTEVDRSAVERGRSLGTRRQRRLVHVVIAAVSGFLSAGFLGHQGIAGQQQHRDTGGVG